MLFQDRQEAGRRLARLLQPFARERPVVVALPRGGVPVAFEVARALDAPLDVLAVRKVGAPGHPELAVGAMAEGHVGVLDHRLAAATGMTPELLDRTVDREAAELERRVAAYRGGRRPTPVDGRTAIIVDDGLATGLTVLAAVRALRGRDAARIVVAVPVGSEEAIGKVSAEADEVVCARIAHELRSVGQWYEDFSQVDDDEVLALLAAGDGHDPPMHRVALSYAVDGSRLAGDLTVPEDPRGLVLFAHGSGSSRLSPRNRAVARALNDRGVATVLLDLLTPVESTRRQAVFDIPLLARRLVAAARWTRGAEQLAPLPLGFFGASTGAAAALRAAAELGNAVGAVVSRGGRPDLAWDDLPRVTAPTLLIVGADDVDVLELNRRAAARLSCPNELAVVPDAGHLFEEPGALETVSELAGRWLTRHLAGTSPVPGVG